MPTLEKTDITWKKELEEEAGIRRPPVRRKRKIYSFEMLINKLDKKYPEILDKEIKDIKKEYPDKLKDIGIQITAVIERVSKIFLRNKGDEKNNTYKEMMDLHKYWKKIGRGRSPFSWVEGYNKKRLKMHLTILASLERSLLKELGYSSAA
ncbi:hypothetical protein GF361_02840 [Candidatus Woesearchaeota archaeon]|nr:hypothetical protein [Candidatus Woesearchaeota archaeon]